MANPPLKETELLFEEETTDPVLEGGARYVSGAFRLTDSLGTYNPRFGGGGYLTIIAAANNPSVTQGAYLSVAGVPTTPGNSPPVLPFTGRIVSAAVGVDESAAPGVPWAVEVMVNGSVELTLSHPTGASTEIFDDSLSVPVSAGDRISVRNAVAGSTTLDKPIVSIVFRLET